MFEGRSLTQLAQKLVLLTMVLLEKDKCLLKRTTGHHQYHVVIIDDDFDSRLINLSYYTSHTNF